jgi:hypothetical protein
VLICGIGERVSIFLFLHLPPRTGGEGVYADSQILVTLLTHS